MALVLNPRVTATELLAVVCEELKLAAPPGATAKGLVDVLDAHLLEAHARGRRTLLIVDEAQDLEPEVLEQVRLLTNLETAKDKLLQVILIGQPELIRMLDRPRAAPARPRHSRPVPSLAVPGGGVRELHPPSPGRGRSGASRSSRGGRCGGSTGGLAASPA